MCVCVTRACIIRSERWWVPGNMTLETPGEGIECRVGNRFASFIA